MSMIEGVLMGMAARTKQQTDAEDRAYLKKKREQEEEDRAFTMSERQRAIQMRTDMGRAAATVEPVEVKQDRPDTMDNRDVGQAGEAPLPTAGYDVAGKRFATKGEATTAAAAANTPQAVTTRMADVAMRNGDPVQAQKLRTGAMEEQAAQFKLNDAQRADLDARFNADLQANVKDFGSLADFISNSAGDGLNGKLKVKFVPTADGKTQVLNVVGPDGTLTPTERVVPNTADGLATAIAETARMPAEKKLAHLHNKAVLAQQAERDANTASHQRGMLAVAQQNANTQEQYRRDQAAALQAKAGPGKAMLESFDEKLARETAHDAVKAENKRRADANQPLLTGDEAATLADSYVSAQRAKHNNNLVITAAVNDLSGLDPASPDYAASYGRALSFGDPKQIASQLKARGLEAPSGQKSQAEAISRDMAKTGVKDAIVYINGRSGAYGTAKMSDFARSAIAGKPGVPSEAPVAREGSNLVPSPGAPMARMTDATGGSAEAPEGAALDVARAARVQAQQALAKFSLVARQRDPQGFAAAQAALAQAQADEAKALQAWQAAVGQQDRAFTRMSQVAGR